MPNHNNKMDSSCQWGKIYISDLLSLQGAGGAEALVYMALSVHAFNEQREAFPTVRTMQEITGLSRGSVLRALKKLKDRGAITENGKTHIGVVKYILGGTKSDTGRGSKSDTGTKSDTGGGSKSDTGGVQNLIPIKHNKTDNTLNTKASYSKASLERDAQLFLLLWEKWNEQALTKWIAAQPLKQYLSLKNRILSLWKSRGYEKSLEHELIILDVFLMQKHIELGKDYTGPPRFWAGEKWIAGLEKWLSSARASHTGGKRRELLPYAISIKVEDTPAPSEREEPASPSSADRWYIQSLQEILEAYEIHESTESLNEALSWLYEDMKIKLSEQELTQGWAAVQEQLQHKNQ